MTMPIDVRLLFLKEELFMQNESQAAQTERPTSRLDNLANQLSATLNSLERASMQHEQILRRLRGSLPETGVDKKAEVDPSQSPVMPYLDILSEKINTMSNKINNQIDELQEFI